MSTAGRRAPGKPPAQLRFRDGSVRVSHLRAAEEAALYSELVHAGQPGLVELVTAKRLPDGTLRMRSRSDRSGYLPAGDGRALAEGLARARRRREEAFTSPLARPAPVPGKKAVERGSVAWCDVDQSAVEPDWPAWLRPSLVVSSGRGLHAYWRLERELPAAGVESINRRLAARFGGDLACTDRGRIMRLPGSFNGKRGAWCAIRRADLTAAPLVIERVVAALPDPDPPRPARRQRFVPRRDDYLAALTPPRYFALLCGLDVPTSGGYVSCPLHEERTASCHVWPDERGWWCFGCSRGGGIYDLASLLAGGPWGRALKGQHFTDTRDRLRQLSAAPPGGSTH
jgi:CHC2-type zinc finger protein/DNA primase RepB-like protein